MLRYAIFAFCFAFGACGSTGTHGATEHIEWGLMGSGGSFRFESGSGATWSFAVTGSDLTLTVDGDRLVVTDGVPAAGVQFLTQDLDTPDITFNLRDGLVVRWQGRTVRVGDVSHEIGPKEQHVHAGHGHR